MSSLMQGAAEVTLSSMGIAQNNVSNILLTDTTAITLTDGYIRAIQVLTDCSFTTLTGNMTTNDTTTATTGSDIGSLDAGTIIYGKFTAVTLAGGSVILYR